jgi:cell division septum initiation protein DivIVA
MASEKKDLEKQIEELTEKVSSLEKIVQDHIGEKSRGAVKPISKGKNYIV